MKAKCVICEREFPIYELFCLRSCRGANSRCVELGCPLVCEKCLKDLKRCLDSLSWDDEE